MTLTAPVNAQVPPLVAGVPVFTFHMVDRHVPSDPIGNALTVTPQQFEAQLRTLSRLHLRTITAARLVADLRRGYLPPRTVVLTFDDGYKDARSYAFPLLRRYGYVGTFYIISSTIGSPRHLTWADLRFMRAGGMEIGAHGVSHVDLTEMDAAGQRGQVEGCSRALEHWIGAAPVTYAYPSGRYNATTLAVMHRTSLRAAFTEDYGFVHSLAAPYRLPRIRVLRSNAVTMFSAVAQSLR